MVAAQGGEPIRVTDQLALNISPAWGIGTSLFFVSDRDGNRDVYWVQLGDSGTPSGEFQRLTTALDAHTVSLSPDSSRLAYSEFRYGTNVWALEIPTGEPASVADAVPVTRGEQVIEAMAVSPDGRWLAFDSNLSGNHDVYRMPIDGGEEEQLTTDPAPDYMTAYSPDGSEISFYSMRSGFRRVYTMPSGGGTPTQITSARGEHRYPTWSPDGLRLAYSVSDSMAATSGLSVVSRETLDGLWGNETVLTDDDGNRPRWSPNGALIAYVITRSTGTSLMLIEPEDGVRRELMRVDDRAAMPAPEFPAWSPDSRTIYYTAFNQRGQSSIWSVSVDGGEPRLLVRFDDLTRWAGRREFATDGERFYFTIGVRESNLWAMELQTR